MRGFLVWILGLVACLEAAGQVTLVEDSRAMGRILASDEEFRPAAEMASEFILRISDARVPLAIGSDRKARKGDVVIRRSDDPRVLEDGYHISTLPGYLVVEAGDGKASQWSLTNDELFEIVAQRIDSIFKANPGMNMISVSQNVNVEQRYDESVKARYVKVDVTGTKQCPHWHYGVGNPCWFFIDEITVI